MTDEKLHQSLVSYCESCLDRYGDCHLGMGWTKSPETAERRCRVMLDVIRNPGCPTSLLDFGCGTSQLLEFMRSRGEWPNVDYSGLDLSEKFLRLARLKFPDVSYYQADILRDPDSVPSFDYVVVSGLFTAKFQMTFDEMFSYFQDVVAAVFQKARIGLAFNVTSKLVDWERDDLFHLPFDDLAEFVSERLSRDFIIRHDYKLFEYTTYVFR